MWPGKLVIKALRTIVEKFKGRVPIMMDSGIRSGPDFIDAMLNELVRRGRALHLIHLLGRLIRNLAVDELIIAGDLWDRGPRGDCVMDYLRLQPNVEFIWGNHGVCG